MATKYHWYKKWSDYKFSHHVHVATAVCILLLMCFSAFLNLIPVNQPAHAAAGSWTKTTFYGTGDGTYTNAVPVNTRADVAIEGINLSNANSGAWAYKRPITVNNSGSYPLTDYQVQLNPFTDGNFFDNSGLVGSWHLNENSGTSTVDNSGSTNTAGTLSSAAWTTGKFGSAFNANGANYVNVGTFAPPSAITLSAWVNPSSLAARQYIYCSGDGTGWNQTGYGIIDSTTLAYFVWGANGTIGKEWTVTVPAMTTGNWYHIAATQASATSIPTLYLNGTAYAASGAVAGSPARSSQQNNIGRNGNTATYYFSGAIDEVLLFNRVLSGTEISNRYGTAGAPKVRGDYQDLRFTKTDGTELSYWQETDGRYWVKFSGVLNTGDNTINMYYGNPSATSSSNGTNTFTFFDDFNRANGAPGGNWQACGDGAQTQGIENGELRYNVYDSSYDGWCNTTAFNTTAGFVLRTRNRFDNATSYGNHISTFVTDKAPNTNASPLTGYGGWYGTTRYRPAANDTNNGYLYLYTTSSSINTNNDLVRKPTTQETRTHPTLGSVYTVDGTQIGTNANGANWATSYLWLVGNGGTYGHTDWILVRKWAPTDTTHSAPSAEVALTPASGTFVSQAVPTTAAHQGKVYGWGDFTFTNTLNGQTLTYDILDGTTGNTVPGYTGINTSPTSLAGISAYTYPTLKARANFSGSGTASPNLNDFSIAYSYDATGPSTPTNLATGAVTSNSIALSWTASTDTESGVAGYEMQRAPDSSGSPGAWANVPSGGCSGQIAATSCTDGSVSANTKYWYRVRAKDNIGNYSYYVTANNSPAWYDAPWTKRKPITISNGGSALTNYQFKMTVTYVASMNSDFSDLRFTDSSGTALIPYWVESYTASTSAVVWVKVPSIAANPTQTTIYMYYGNPSATSASNGDDTFLLFDDFESGNLNKWIINNFPLIGGAYARNGNYGVRVLGQMNNYINKGFTASSTAVIEFDGKLLDGFTYAGTSTTNSRRIGSSALDATNHFAYDGVVNAFNISGTSNVWRSYKIVVGPSQTDYFVNGVQGSYSTAGATSSVSNFYMYAGETVGGTSNGSAYYDNIKVRAYAGTEPTSSAGSEDSVQFNVFATTLVAVPNLNVPATPQNVLKPTISGTGATPNTTVRLYDNGTLKASLTADGSGNFTFNASTPGYADFSEGNHTNVTARGYNGSTETADSSPARTVLLDIQNPVNGILMGAWTNSGKTSQISDNAWSGNNSVESVYFEWNGAVDEPVLGSPSGIKRYHVYFGPNNAAVPKDDGTPTAGTEENATRTLSSPASGTDYYMRIQVEDNAGNYSSASTLFTYKFDNTPPSSPTTITPSPPGWSTTNSFDFQWTNWTETHSGMDYWLYVRKETSGGDTYEAFDPVNRKVTDVSNPIDLTAKTALYTGINWIRVYGVDKAGNTSSVYGQTPYFYSGTVAGPTIAAIPGFNTQNSFSFTITKPGGITANGYYCGVSSPVSPSNTTYIKFSELPKTVTINGKSTNGTLAGDVVTLSAFAAAIQSGVNYLYCATEDNFGNIGWTQATNTSFTVNTTAPDVATGMKITDASDRGNSNWALTVGWTALTGQPPDFYGYEVWRCTASCNNIANFNDKRATVTSNIYSEAGLSEVTDYYYRIKSVDNVGNTSAFSDAVHRIPTGKFTTPPTVTSGPVVAAKALSATITWTTNRASESAVYVGTGPSTCPNGSSVGSTTAVTAHTVDLTGLTPGTTYRYKIQSLDKDRDYTGGDGDACSATEYTFTTLSAPGISDVQISEIRLNSAIVSWKTTSAATSKILYGRNTGYGTTYSDTSSSQTTTHTVKLSDLSDSTTYHLKIQGTDIDGNALQSDDYVFTTLTFPRLSELKVAQVPNTPTSTVKITFDSNVPTSSLVTVSGKGGKDVAKYDLETAHEISVPGLSDNTPYTVTVKGRDQYGNEARSVSTTYKTDFDTRPPLVSDITVETSIVGYGMDAKGQIVVSWTTDEPATSQVEYGSGVVGDFTSKTQEDTSLTESHVVIISELKPSSPYHFRVVSKDSSSNTGISADSSVLTEQASESIIDLIIKSLQSSIGWIFNVFVKG